MLFINPAQRRRAVAPEAFENTFAPAVDHERLSIDQIIVAMSVGAIHPADLPPAVGAALGAEIKKREGKSPMAPLRFLTLVLGTMGEIRHQLRLQRYVFLADNLFSRSRQGSMTPDLMYDWKPHPDGPFSEDLNTCIRSLSKAQMLETFEVHESNKDHTGHRLTARGNEEFRSLLRNLKGESDAIRDLLVMFQHDYTDAQLIDFVCQMYPDYATKPTSEKNTPQ